MKPTARIRKCTKCGLEEKFSPQGELSEFYRHTAGRSKDGYLARCKRCIQAELAERRRLNPEPHRRSSKDWQATHAEEYREYQKAYRTAFREELNRARRRLRAEDPYHRARYNANTAVYLALRAGKLVRPDHCQQCQAIGRVQAHHHHGYDDDHRLDVIWLCLACHEAEHLTKI